MYQYDMDMKCWTEVVDAEIKHNAMSKFQQNNGADDEEEDGDTNHDECQINNTHCEQMADSEILSAFLWLSVWSRRSNDTKNNYSWTYRISAAHNFNSATLTFSTNGIYVICVCVCLCYKLRILSLAPAAIICACLRLILQLRGQQFWKLCLMMMMMMKVKDFVRRHTLKCGACRQKFRPPVNEFENVRVHTELHATVHPHTDANIIVVCVCVARASFD